MDKKCEVCEFIKNPSQETQILNTDHWSVGIDGRNHAYLGRAYVTLKQHKTNLSSLSQDEWADFQEIVKKLEIAYKKAYGAEPLNWGCFMNHAFREKPFNPHVHWHIYPRYEVEQVVDGVTFDDPLYGQFYDNKAERLIPQTTVEQIATTLRQHIS